MDVVLGGVVTFVDTMTVVFCCWQTVQGMVIVVGAHVEQGITTEVVMIWDVVGCVEEPLLEDEDGAEPVEVGVGVLPVGTGFTAEFEDGGVEEAQALLFTPVLGFLLGLPGTLRVLPIHNLSQSRPGLAFSSSENVRPKLSAILTP